MTNKENFQVSAPTTPDVLCGVDNKDYCNILLNQVIFASHFQQADKDERKNIADSLLVAITSFKPQDVIEGQLAAQMIACHNAAMDCYRRNMIPDQTFIGRQENMKQAAKLNRAYAGLVEALNRHRGKGQQKMTVEHVHVYEGGQAIVGQVTRPEGGWGTNKNGGTTPCNYPCTNARNA